MVDIISKIKVSALIASAAFIVAACGEKAPEAAADVTIVEPADAPEAVVEVAPAVDATATDGAAMDAAPVEETAPAAE